MEPPKPWPRHRTLGLYRTPWPHAPPAKWPETGTLPSLWDSAKDVAKEPPVLIVLATIGLVVLVVLFANLVTHEEPVRACVDQVVLLQKGEAFGCADPRAKLEVEPLRPSPRGVDPADWTVCGAMMARCVCPR